MQLVMIDIADENDNPPYFKHDFYKAGETAGLSWFVASYCNVKNVSTVNYTANTVTPRRVQTIFTSSDSKSKGDCHQLNR